MIRLAAVFFTAATLFAPLSAEISLTNQYTKDKMKSDLDFIRNTFSVHYAPAQWKAKYSGWDLETEISKAKERIQNSDKIGVRDFQKIVRDFFKSTKDYHVSVYFQSTESASLPFRIKGAHGRYFFTYINYRHLSSLAFPISPGDELISIDGKPTEQVINELRDREIGYATDSTDRAFAEMFLTNRHGLLGHIVPKGPVLIQVKSAFTGTVSSYQLIWKYNPEKITDGFWAKGTDTKPQGLKAFLNKSMMSPVYEQLLKAFELTNNEDQELKEGELGNRKSFVPYLGKIWWVTNDESPYHAYIFENEEKKLIGYIRIPHYSADEIEAQEFARIIDLFQDRTEALVIDQVNNPGGFFFYMYALASMLTDQPLITPKHHIAITQNEVASAISLMPILEEVESDEDAQNLLGATLFGYPVTYQVTQFILDYCRFIIEEWNMGRPLTNSNFLYGVDHINPHPTSRYTKPVLVLINGMDISCGDFFPAIMQDNKRVTLFGSRTAGAGGFVLGAEYQNLFGVANFRYTGSIAERIDNSPIENLGVMPDIVYEVTPEDIQFGYQDYVEAVNKAVKGLIK